MMPAWLVILFVVPILKYFLFVALAVAPEREPASETSKSAAGPLKERFRRVLPTSKLGSAAFTIFSSALPGLAAVALGTEVLKNYGWALFVGTPFCLGFLAALIHGASEPRTLKESILVALLSVTLVGLMLVAVALEGLICILMAAPLGLGLAAICGLAGHAVHVAARQRTSANLYCATVLMIPVMLAIEKWANQPVPTLKVCSAVEIDAPVERVWENVISFAELPPPARSPFQNGHRISDARGASGQGARGGAALRVLDRSLCGTDRRLGCAT